MSLDRILEEKEILKKQLLGYQKNMLDVEMKLLSIEKKIANLSEMNIVTNMSLNDKQREIVESKSNNILVVACPGSGKTHTLISRYINLVVKEKVNPMNIILITFTKKAGMEMNQRISNILPGQLPYYVGSLHGLGYRLLQHYNSINYTVLDEKESHIILRECTMKILEQSTIDAEEQDSIKKQIVYIYDKISSSYPLNIGTTLKECSISAKYKTLISAILKEYKQTKKNQELVDFNDLMIQLCGLLASKKIHPFMDSIKYLFFDEYQDINPIQQHILAQFAKQSNIMVVGDDAQSIYAFRGSSIKYIWEFETIFTNVSTYYLETNYRSTPSIVNFFQDIIKHNSKQFNKNVISSLNEPGLKPHIFCCNSAKEQYVWIANDIKNKRDNGIPLKNMVILARKNYSLDQLEFELIKHSIPVVKSIGTSLLNKHHVKDFIAFLVIHTNPKSSIHWKRILALHKNIGITKANAIIENTDTIMTTIQNYTELIEFHKFMLLLARYKPKEMVIMIREYLSELWIINREKDVEKRLLDITNLIMYMGNSSISDFISNLHLNIDIENSEDCLYLSTVHGAKGLEWEHVYIIDMNSKDFPNIRQSFYKEEMDNCEEERRLFYVAASRAKKYLTITTTIDESVFISPFIREIDTTLYFGSNIAKQLAISYQLTGNISHDVTHFLRFNGYEKLSTIVSTLEHTRSSLGLKTELPTPVTLKNRYIAGNMMDCLVAKMLHNNFPDIIAKFDIVYQKVSDTIYHQYIDRLVDWRNILEQIYIIATNKTADEQWKSYLLSSDAVVYYNILEKMLVKYICNLKPTAIKIQLNVSKEPIRGIIDILITCENGNNVLIEMKTSPDDICNFPNVCQTLMYSYLLGKKQINVDTIVLLNLWDGTLDQFNTTTWNTNNINQFKKILYTIS